MIAPSTTTISNSPGGAVDMTVPVAPRRSSRLRLTAEAICWGARRVETAEIVDVRYATRFETTALWQQRLVRRVIVEGTQGSIEVALGTEWVGGDAEEQQSGAYMALVDHIHATVEPRLRRGALRVLERGGRIGSNGLSVTSTGLVVESERRRGINLVAWERLPSAQFEDGSVHVYARGESGSERVAEISMLARHAVILPELIEEAIARFC